MKALAFIVFFMLSHDAACQLQVRVGDSVIVATKKISYWEGYGGCVVSTWQCTSSDFGVIEATGPPDYEYSIYFKPTIAGIRYDTCKINTLCSITPPGEDWLTASDMHYFYIEAKDSMSSVNPTDAYIQPSLEMLWRSHRPVVKLSMGTSEWVGLTIANVLGKTVSILAEQTFLPGEYEYQLDLAPGLYFAILTTHSYKAVYKVLVL